MKANGNNELDSLLLNLAYPSQKGIWAEAIKHRDAHSLINKPWTYFGVNYYQYYGPGVKLYFALIKYLIALFGILWLCSIPSLLSNYNGNGLYIYGQYSYFDIMRLSLANQPIYEVFVKYRSQVDKANDMNKIRSSQYMIIFNDVLRSIILLTFLIFWHFESQRIVNEMVNKDALPSYYTLIVSNIVAKHPKDIVGYQDVTKAELLYHFQKFGEVEKVELIYDYGNFLFEVQQFLALIDRYNNYIKQSDKDKIYKYMELAYFQLKTKYEERSHKMQEKCKNEEAQYSPCLYLRYKQRIEPFELIKAFVSFTDPRIRNNVKDLYDYYSDMYELQFRGRIPRVYKCHVEPTSIIWENYHMETKIDFIRGLFYGIIVIVLLVVSLLAIFVVSVYTTSLVDSQRMPESTGTGNETSQYYFCSKITYLTFQWKYYDSCLTYFQNYKYKWAYILLLSVLVTIITAALNRVIFSLVELRRHRTLPEKKRFLIINIFIGYLVTTSLLILLIRGEINVGYTTVSLLKLLKDYIPNINLRRIELFSDFNRKWYVHIGQLITTQFFLALVICPWLYIIGEYMLRYIRHIKAYFSRTQQKMNLQIENNYFSFEDYYSMLLNCIYFCLIYSIAMPIFFGLALLSMVSYLICSKIIFHKLSKKPHMYDHKINTFVSKLIVFSLFLHQLTSVCFVYVEDIFPHYENTKTWTEKSVFIFLALLVLIYLFNTKKVAQIINKKVNKTVYDLALTQYINSTLNGSNKEQHDNPKKNKRILVHTEFQRIVIGSFLSSYCMEDNIKYNRISYTLTVLEQSIKYHNKMRYKDEKVDDYYVLQGSISPCDLNYYQKYHAEAAVYYPNRELQTIEPTIQGQSLLSEVLPDAEVITYRRLIY